MSAPKRLSRLLVAAAGAAVLLLALGGCGSAPAAGPTHRAAPTAPNGASTATAPAAAATTTPAAASALPGRQPIPDSTLTATSLRIPAIGVDTRLDRLALGADGVLQKPPHWDVPGWYAGGTVPGEQGPAVIAGHVDKPGGTAVFWKLRGLRPGDRIEVTRSDHRTVTFEVTTSVRYPQARFPTDEVYGPTPDRALRLITCDGTYDHKAGRYRDNRVVYAVAVPS